MELGTPESISINQKIRFGTSKLTTLSVDNIEDREYDEEKIFSELIPLNFELPINKDFNIDEMYDRINNKKENILNSNERNISKIGFNKKTSKNYTKKMNKDNLDDNEGNLYPFKEEPLCNIY